VTHNTALRELGFSAADRVVIVHADDVGMCNATVNAFFELAEHGVISSGSVMVPCPWFPAVAADLSREC
jgi:chitin disaccharide deacetylase